MKFLITLNGEKQEKEIPTGWSQVTFRQCVELAKIKNDIKAKVSLFTGIPIDILQKAEIHNLDKIIAVLSFTDNKELPLDLPSTVLGYPIVKDLDSKSIAQAADIQTIMESFKEETPIENLEKFPLIVATYIAPTWFVNKEYDYSQAEKIAPLFFDAPCTEVMAIGNFTSARYVAWKSGIVRTSPREATPLTKLRRVIKDWQKSLAFTIRFYLWKKSLPSHVRSYLNGQ